MLLTTRVATLETGLNEAIGLALEAHAIVHKVSDLDLGVYLGGAGYEPNTFFFSAIVENMADYSTQSQKLMASEEYTAFTSKVAPVMSGPGDSRLRSLVAMAPAEPSEIPLDATVDVFNATMTPTKLAEAMQFGVEMTNYYSAGTGEPLAFLRNVAGNVGEVSWIGVHATAADIDKAIEWEATDAGYLERYASAGDLFLPGSVTRGFMTRLA